MTHSPKALNRARAGGEVGGVLVCVREIMCRQIALLSVEGKPPPTAGARYYVGRRGDGSYGFWPIQPGAPLPPIAAFPAAVPVVSGATVAAPAGVPDETFTSYLVLEDGRPAGLVTPVEWLQYLARHCRDTEAHLRDLEEWKSHMESTFEVSSADLFTTDARGVVTRASVLAEELYGMCSSAMVGKKVQDLARDSVFHPSAAAAALRSRTRQVVVQSTASGRKLIVTATPVIGPDGQVERVVGLVRDITDAVKFQQELDRSRQTTDAFFDELRHYVRQQRASSGIAAASAEMRRVLVLAEQVSSVDTNVLILGESGAGKEVIARRIHELSPRCNGSFIKTDCASLPEGLIESELFGYERGAFTGAQREGKMGLVELADNGTLFLDEIGEMPVSMQAKLLRVIQDREFFRVGGVKPVRVNVRLISATNRDLAEEVRQGRFRRDLFYRLNVVPIRLPPLRDRREDIPVLIDLFLDRFSQRYDRPRVLSPQAMQILMGYSWPGNVRQLENVMERLVVTTESSVIQPQDLADDVLQSMLHDGPAVSVQDVVPLKDAQEAVERQLLRLARQRFGTETRMAQALGVHQSTVSRMLQRYYGSGSLSDE